MPNVENLVWNLQLFDGAKTCLKVLVLKSSWFSSAGDCCFHRSLNPCRTIYRNPCAMTMRDSRWVAISARKRLHTHTVRDFCGIVGNRLLDEIKELRQRIN